MAEVEKRYCSKCNKTMSKVKFYLMPDGKYCELCKDCLTMHIDTYNEETYLWMLEKFDVPYLPWIWKERREAEFEKNYTKVQGSKSKDPMTAAFNMTKGSGVVFGKYLGQMKLNQWKKYHWADTERLQKEHAEQVAEQEEVTAGTVPDQDDLRQKFEAGEISEAQYMTYMELDPKKMEVQSLESSYLAGKGGNPSDSAPSAVSAYPENEHPFEVVDIPDVGANLTDEDKLYLAMKWGRLYSAADWVWLEQKYKDFMESFDIQGAARLDTLIMICKTSLKMNYAIDSGDVENYQRLSKVYDAMMKAAKFTEAQKKDEQHSALSCYGQLVAFAEKEGGKIPRIDLSIDRDIADEDLHNIKKWTKELVEDDASIAKQIEQYIKKRDALTQQRIDMEQAIANGEETYQVTDQDLSDFNSSAFTLGKEEEEEFDDEFITTT